MLEKIKKIFLILSGKGGVGKSTVAIQLSLALRENGNKVGLLDLDLCGPSVPYLLGLENENIYQNDSGWLPIYTYENKTNKNNATDDKSNPLAVMSIGFLLNNRNEAVVWRGPKKTAMINQFLNDVDWGELDYLIIDTPPGTSDEHITVMECLRNIPCNGAIIVTTPQLIAIDDVRKEITFCKKTNIKIYGLIENMNGYICPHCENCTNIFSSNGGEELAKLADIPLLGSLPIEPKISESSSRESVMKRYPESKSAKAFENILKNLLNN